MSKRLSPTQVRAVVTKKWDAHHANWLVDPDNALGWPQTFNLNSLSEKDVLADLAGTREWVSSWRKWSGTGGTVEWNSRRWTSGDQELPARLVLASPLEMAQFLGRDASWVRSAARYAAWCSQFPGLAGSKAVARICDDVLIHYDDADFARLTKLLQWLVANRSSGLYLRQLPVADVDTKWVWPRRGIVQSLIRHILSDNSDSGFHALCGLRPDPVRMRMRVLCPRLRMAVGGLCDIEAPISELARLELEPRVVMVVENLNTGVALPDVDGAVVFMGLGMAVDQLESITWLRDAEQMLYWGDLDTHGFAILARARKRFPNIVSLLMDEETLFSHRILWVREPSQSKIESPEGLTESELDTYAGLRTDRWGDKVRLEQERIGWPAALSTIREALSCPRQAIHAA
ncbi:Wadjet anti-phage system protein JetD domain-containing protein [Cupriavidus nantongensis]|uniref:Wadjet anti-phage system protein JetD domain-containing protein n=1 Tax=Cupriavidus nantongensis TaxID=1796606 RepID=UPI00358F833A